MGRGVDGGLECPEDFGEEVRRAGRGVFADLLLLVGDHGEKAVESLARDVAVEIAGGVVALLLRAAPRHHPRQTAQAAFFDHGSRVAVVGSHHRLVVGGHLRLLGVLLDDGKEGRLELRRRLLAEVLRRRVVGTGKNLAGVVQAHVGDRLAEDGRRFGDRLLRRAVEGENEVVDVAPHPHLLQPRRDELELLGNRDLHRRVAEVAILLAQLVNGQLRTDLERFAQAAVDLRVAQRGDAARRRGSRRAALGVGHRVAQLLAEIVEKARLQRRRSQQGRGRRRENESFGMHGDAPGTRRYDGTGGKVYGVIIAANPFPGNTIERGVMKKRRKVSRRGEPLLLPRA